MPAVRLFEHQKKMECLSSAKEKKKQRFNKHRKKK